MKKITVAILTAIAAHIVSISEAHSDGIRQGEFGRSPKAVAALQSCLGAQTLQEKRADSSIEETLKSNQNAVALDLVSIAPENYSQWLNRFASPVVKNYGMAAHETNHFVNAILRTCFSERTGYYFFGDVYFIDVRPAETPNYSTIDKTLPAQFVSLRQSFRYSQYVEKSRAHRGNDFRILMDEFLSSIVGATVELVYYQAQSVPSLKDADAVLVNADVIGAQEFAVYVAFYLTDLKASMPAAYQRVICSADGPAVLKHAWERLELIRESQAKQDRSHFSPRARQTPPEVTEFLTSDAAQSIFKNPCDRVR